MILLLSDVINTMSAHVTRKLHEVRVSLTCRLTVGEDVPLLTDVLQTAVSRADTVIVVGGLNEEEQYITLKALATITGHPLPLSKKFIPRPNGWGAAVHWLNGWLLPTDEAVCSSACRVSGTNWPTC
jgi:molybdopterin-biosynthesis enzyme MoeA-like protein